MSRFAHVTESDLERLIDEKESKNTMQSIKDSMKFFREILGDKGEEITFNNFEKSKKKKIKIK